jgi:hypothetical protein
MTTKRIKAIGMIALIIAATLTAWSSIGNAQNCAGGRQGVRGGAEGGVGNGHGCY